MRSPLLAVTAALVLAGCSSAGHTAQGGTEPGPTGSAGRDAPPPVVATRQPCPATPDRAFHFRAGRYSFQGYTRGTGTRVAILLHGSPGTECDLAGLAARLARRGYRTVSWTTAPGPTPEALTLLVARERDRGTTRIVLVGASAGGATTLVAAGRIEPPVDAVVALSPASRDRRAGDVTRSIARYRGPVMVVAAEFDSAYADGPRQVAGAHDGPETATLYPGIDEHGQELVPTPAAQVADDVVRFLDRAARRWRTSTPR
jgi:dienelactone hydrolase